MIDICVTTAVVLVCSVHNICLVGSLLPPHLSALQRGAQGSHVAEVAIPRYFWWLRAVVVSPNTVMIAPGAMCLDTGARFD